MDDKIFVVLSRERGFIGARRKESDAEALVKEQTKAEEMGGSRPSVWYKETELK